jgi:hypothetical protein
MVKALARAFRWREMLENKHANITEIAAVEKVNESYVRRVRLTLLGTGHRRGDPRRTAIGGDNAGRADAAVRRDVDGAAEDINRLLTTFAGLS